MTDYERVASNLEALAALLREHGERDEDTLDGWTHGPIPGDTHDTPPQPGDPDYEGPDLDATPGRLDDDDRQHLAAAKRALIRWHTLLDDLDHARRGLTALHHIANPPRPQHRGRPDTPTDAADDGYCRSCFRDRQYTEEADTTRYRDLCGWCGRWKASHNGELPSVEVLRHVHDQSRRTGRGFRLTEADHHRFMGHQRA
jgi:hypothetical protein